MNLLVFETATPSGGVALYRQGRLAGCMLISAQRHHSRLCLDLARQLLEVESLDWSAVDVLAASHGPGSFTGVRVALVQAKALAYSLQKPLVSVCSMQALALNASVPPGGRTLVLLDARRGEFYAALYESGLDQVPVPIRAPETVPANALASWLGKDVIGDLRLCGEGALLPDTLPSLNGADISAILASVDRCTANPAATGLLALREAQAGRFASVAESTAVYLRHPVG